MRIWQSNHGCLVLGNLLGLCWNITLMWLTFVIYVLDNVRWKYLLHYSVFGSLCRSLCSVLLTCQSTQLSRWLPADLFAICLILSLKSQIVATFLDFHLFLKRTLGQINKNYTKNQVRKNCTIYVKIGDLLFF